MHAALLSLLACTHTTSIAHEQIAVEGAVAQVEMRVQAATCRATLDLDRDKDQRLSAEEVAAGRGEIESYVLEHFLLSAGGTPLAGRLVSVRPAEGLLVERGGAPEPLLEIVLRFEAPSEIARLEVESHLFRASELAHRDHVEIAWTGRAPAARVLSADDPRWAFDPADGRAPSVLAAYVRLGFDHILGGWDHLAFLVALVAASRRWQSLLGAVTAFTAAHSLSLGLAATGVVVLPARLVEPAIAISIAWVAARNLLARAPRRTWPEAFGFGLVHGLGFAGFLGELLAGEPQKLAALFGFNVGVEIGQAAIVTALHLFLRGLAREGARAAESGTAELAVAANGSSRELDRPRLALSGAVLLLGTYWSVSRLCSG